MQTFLPYPDFEKSAAVLDMKRLGKQRVEAWQIWLALSSGSGWKNHPAVKMWSGHIWWLLLYGAVVCESWRRLGYKDTLLQRFTSELGRNPVDDMPPWLGNERVHSSHRANLIRKDPKHYGRYGWVEEAREGYHWPTREKWLSDR